MSTATAEPVRRRDLPPGSVVAGVDTHKDVHVAAALDELGRLLSAASFPTNPAGYRRLSNWLSSFGRLAAVGVEGTGCWGAGLARHLTAAGIEVVEVNRPNRQRRRRLGKSDAIDAEEAARAVLAGDARGVPKTATGLVECIRQLRIARRGALKARIQATNTLHALIDTAPEDIRGQLRPLSHARRVQLAARYRPGPPSTPSAAAKYALACLARRLQILETEIADLTRQLDALTAAAAPELHARYGLGTDTVGALLVAAGDNPQRLRHEKSFAALCGASPVQASSGRTQRHRLNRGGNREANSALWRIVIVRMKYDPATRAYVDRRTKEGLSKPEIIRCLKRYIARQVYRDLVSATDLRGPGRTNGGDSKSSAASPNSPTADTSDQSLPGPATATLRRPANP